MPEVTGEIDTRDGREIAHPFKREQLARGFITDEEFLQVTTDAFDPCKGFPDLSVLDPHSVPFLP